MIGAVVVTAVPYPKSAWHLWGHAKDFLRMLLVRKVQGHFFGKMRVSLIPRTLIQKVQGTFWACAVIGVIVRGDWRGDAGGKVPSHCSWTTASRDNAGELESKWDRIEHG